MKKFLILLGSLMLGGVLLAGPAFAGGSNDGGNGGYPHPSCTSTHSTIQVEGLVKSDPTPCATTTTTTKAPPTCVKGGDGGQPGGWLRRKHMRSV